MLRGLAGLFALTWLTFPGFGLFDLAVTWDDDWPQVLEAGWGLFFVLLVAAPFGLAMVRPARIRTAIAQLTVGVGVLTASALASSEPQLLRFALAVAVETAVIGWLGRPLLGSPRPVRVSMPLLVVLLAGVVPWLAYAFRMYDLNRLGSPVDITVGVDHYSVQGAVGLASVALVLLAAAWPEGRRFISACVGMTAVYLGLVSYAWPDAAGGFERPWSAGCIAWGLAVVAAGVAPLDRAASRSA